MAMNEILCAPSPFTISASNGVTTPENLFGTRLGRTAQFAANGYVVCDVGSNQALDTFALLATNAGSGVKWRVRAYPTSAAAVAGTGPTYDSGLLPVWASVEAGRRYHRQGLIAPAVADTKRFWRVDVSTACKVGRLVLGDRYTALDTMDIGYGFRIVDNGDTTRSSTGLDNSTIRGKSLEYSWTWSWMTEQEARGALLDILGYAGTTRDVLVVLNPDAKDLHNVIGWGRIVEEIDLINKAGGNVTSAYEASMRLRSKLILNL